MNSVLVVGGAGYIGGHVCQALAPHYTPVVYDNFSTGHSWAVRFGPHIEADLEDEAALVRALNHYRPEAVIHLASLINVRDSIANPALYYQKNLFGTLSLLKAMVQTHTLNLVFSSTAAIYGTPLHLPITESHPKNPLNAYGKTKWACEGMIEDFAHAHGLRFAILRYFNACGADPSGLLGEAHEPETHLIPLAINAAFNQSPLNIYGDDYPTPDGTAIRDYVHVLDLASAHIQALRYLQTHRTSLQANLGTGTGYSVRQILNAISRHTQKPIPVNILPRLAHDSAILVADPTLAKEKLHWEPTHSSLPTIIATACRWHQSHHARSLLAALQSTKVNTY